MALDTTRSVIPLPTLQSLLATARLLAVASSRHAADDQAFIDALADDE